MDVSNSEGRILEFLQDIFQRLESVGYGISRERNGEKPLSCFKESYICMSKVENHDFEYMRNESNQSSNK